MLESSSIKKVSLTLIGKDGKMGRVISALVEKDPFFEISKNGDVIVDFSSPSGTQAAIAMNKPLVCGTTGLTKEIFEQMKELATRVPVLYSPNFSLGISLLFEMMQTYTHQLQKLGSIAIRETHHTEKVDSPSGTAVKLGKILETDRIEAKRKENIVGIHEVEVKLDHETLLFRHESHSRDAFAKGALTCAKFLLNTQPKLYKLSDIFQPLIGIQSPSVRAPFKGTDLNL